jgi:pimeloyl-ACP methyl ester carboxylesterase
MKRIKYKTILVFLFVVNLGFSQPFQIGHTTINFIDGSRSNRVIATEIYYPSDVAGDNVSMSTATSVSFPVLSFGHGFVMTWDSYQNIWSYLVPNGYIMIFPKTEGSLSPSHLDFAKDLSFVLEQMVVLGNNSTSIFFNRISAMNAVMGHSMGGGASFLAAQLNSNIKTLVNFAPAETNPSAINAAASITIPSLIFAGVNDCVTPPSTNQVPMYNGLTSACKTLINIIGASHCQMSNSNTLCNFGELSCTPTPTITRSVQHAKIFSYLLPWLDYQLKGNCAQGNLFDIQLIGDISVTYFKNCIQCNALDNGIIESLDDIVLYPNPVKEVLLINGKYQKGYQIIVFDLNMRKLLDTNFIQDNTIDTSKWSTGLYFYELISDGKTKAKGKFIKQ